MPCCRSSICAALYLRGVSTGDFQDASTALPGADAPNLSAGVISRLMAGWQKDYDRWRGRDLSARGLAVPPELAVGDRAPGFPKALDQVFPGTRHQRCRVPKLGNVLDHFPKSMQPAVTADLREISHAETRAAARAAIETFKEKHAAKYARGVACLTRDSGALPRLCDFPAEHRDRLRTSNPVESVFTVRHRTVRTKGQRTQKTARLMVFTLGRAASKKWRQLNGVNRLPRVLEGVKFNDGIAQGGANQSRTA